MDDTAGLSAGDVVMVVQSSDDRGSAGVFEFSRIKAVMASSSQVQLSSPLSHTFTSGSETLWKQLPTLGACTDVHGGFFTRGVLGGDITLATCKGLCESAGELCAGLQYIPPDRNVRTSTGGCTLLSVSETDSSDFEDRTDKVFNDWFDPVDDDLAVGTLPIATSVSQEWAATSQCWAMTTPATPAAVWDTNSMTATCAGAGGIASLGTDGTVKSAPACQVRHCRSMCFNCHRGVVVGGL